MTAVRGASGDSPARGWSVGSLPRQHLQDPLLTEPVPLPGQLQPASAAGARLILDGAPPSRGLRTPEDVVFLCLWFLYPVRVSATRADRRAGL